MYARKDLLMHQVLADVAAGARGASGSHGPKQDRQVDRGRRRVEHMRCWQQDNAAMRCRLKRVHEQHLARGGNGREAKELSR